MKKEERDEVQESRYDECTEFSKKKENIEIQSCSG